MLYSVPVVHEENIEQIKRISAGVRRGGGWGGGGGGERRGRFDVHLQVC